MNDRMPRCRIYLVVDAGADLPSGPELRHALACGDVAALLVRVALADRGRLAPLVRAAQLAGAAVLIEDDVEAAVALAADGVHLPSTGADDEARRHFAAARARLGEGAIIGAAAGGSRHAAMVWADLGADYVAFDCDDADARENLLAWWADVAVVPAVGFAVSALEVAALVEAGSDFIAIAAGGDAAGAVAATEMAIRAAGAAPRSTVLADER